MSLKYKRFNGSSPDIKAHSLEGGMVRENPPVIKAHSLEDEVYVGVVSPYTQHPHTHNTFIHIYDNIYVCYSGDQQIHNTHTHPAHTHTTPRHTHTTHTHRYTTINILIIQAY